MGHVFARLTGYGYSMVPVDSPYKFRWGRNNRTVLIDIETDKSTAEIHYPEGKAFEEFSEGADMDEIVEITPVEHTGPFRVETSVFSVNWPSGFEIESSGSGEGPPYDIIGPDDTLIYIQGPIEKSFVPPIEELVAPGQRLTDKGTAHECQWVELSYSHEKVKWCQRHFRHDHGEHVFLITGQAPVKKKSGMIDALNEVAASFQIMTEGDRN
ncbi:MAG: hypothetical protein P1V97_27920 [Planctomycetota bacterium]|nr:hypothetical protein [Planctomycetota bacterium]